MTYKDKCNINQKTVKHLGILQTGLLKGVLNVQGQWRRSEMTWWEMDDSRLFVQNNERKAWGDMLETAHEEHEGILVLGGYHFIRRSPTQGGNSPFGNPPPHDNRGQNANEANEHTGNDWNGRVGEQWQV